MSQSPRNTARQSTTMTRGTASSVQDYKNSSTNRHNNNNNTANENRAREYSHYSASKSPKPTTRGSSSDRHQTDYGILINSRGCTRATSRNSTQHGGSIGNASFNREVSVGKANVSHLTTASGATMQLLGAANGLMKAKAARRRGMLGPEAIILDVNSKMLATMMPGHRREELEKLGKLEAKYKKKLREQIALVRSTQGLASANNGVLSPRQLLAAVVEHHSKSNKNNNNNKNDDDDDDNDESAGATALQSPEINQLLFGNLVNSKHGIINPNKININNNFTDAVLNVTAEDNYNNNTRTKNNTTTTPNRSAIDSALEVKRTTTEDNYRRTHDDVDSKSEQKLTHRRHRHHQKNSNNNHNVEPQQQQQQRQGRNIDHDNKTNKSGIKNAQNSINSNRNLAVENPFRLAGAVGGRQSVFNRISYLPKQNPGYYIKLKELGKGSCATTYLVEWVPPGGQSVVAPYITPEMILGSDKIKKKWAENQQKKIETALSRANNEQHNNYHSVVDAVVSGGAAAASCSQTTIIANNQKQQQQRQSSNHDESSAAAGTGSGAGTSPLRNNVMNNQNDDINSNNNNNQTRRHQNNAPSQGMLGLLSVGTQAKDCPFFPTTARSEIRSKKCKLLRHRLFYPSDECCFEDLQNEIHQKSLQQQQRQLRRLPPSESEIVNSGDAHPLRAVLGTATTENNNNQNNNIIRGTLPARRINSRRYSSSRRSMSVVAASSTPSTARKPFVTCNFEKIKLYVSNSVATRQFILSQAEQQHQENIFYSRNLASSLGADSSRQQQQLQQRLATIESALGAGDNTTPTDAAAASSSKSQENNNNNNINNQRMNINKIVLNGNLLEDDLFDSNLLDFLEPDCFEPVFPKLNMSVFLNDLHAANNNNNNYNKSNATNNNLHDRSIQTDNGKNNNNNNNNNGNDNSKNVVQQQQQQQQANTNKENSAENPDSTPSATPTLTPTPSPATTITATHNGNNPNAAKSPALEVLGSIYERGKNVFIQQPENISFASASRQSQQSPKTEKLPPPQQQQQSQQQQQQQQQQHSVKTGPSTEADGATISDVKKKKKKIPKNNNHEPATEDSSTTTATTADSVTKDIDTSKMNINKNKKAQRKNNNKNDENNNNSKENGDNNNNRRRGNSNSNRRQRNYSLNSSLVTLNWGPHQISKECVDLLRPGKPSCLGVTTKTIPVALALDVPLVLLQQHQDRENNIINNNPTISGGLSPATTRLSSPLPQLQGITRKVVPPATVVAYPTSGGTMPATGTIAHQRARLLQTQAIKKTVEVPRENIFVCKIETRADSDGYTVTPMTEKAVLANCAHPNIVGYIDSFADPVSEFLVMEYVDGGDLKQMLKNRIDAAAHQQQQLHKSHNSSRRQSTNNSNTNNNNNNNDGVEQKYLSERSVLFLFVQMCMSVEYLHRHNMLHRDIKTANFLVSKKWLVKLADFGFAKQYNDVVNNLGNKDVDLNCTMTSLGTPYYMAPEMIQRASSGDGVGQHINVGYSDKADMWALGVVLYELVTLQKPFPGPNVDDVISRVLNNEPTPLPRNSTSEQFHCSDQLRTLIRFLLSKRPEKRPSAKQILQLPFMVDAMSRYVEKYSSAALSSQCPQDTVWAQILKEHQQLILADNLTGPKSTRRIRQEIRESVQGFTSVMSGVSKRKMSIVENDSPASSSASSTATSDEDEDDDDDDDEEDAEEEEEEQQEEHGQSQK